MNIELDSIDLKILQLLKQDSRLTHKEIGQRVHRTGQAVGARIAQLMDVGILKNYTVALNYEHKQFIQLFLNDAQAFQEIERIVKDYSQIDECFKVCGNACYMVISHFEPKQLNIFLEHLSHWCRYSVDTVIREIEVVCPSE